MSSIVPAGVRAHESEWFVRPHAAFYSYGVAVKLQNSGRSNPMKVASEPKWTEFVLPPWLGLYLCSVLQEIGGHK